MFEDFFSTISERIASAGYSSDFQFFSNNAGLPYGVLLRKIGKKVAGTNHFDVPMLALRHFHRRTDVAARGERDFAQDALTRSLLQHLGSGWGNSARDVERRATAFAEWNSLERDCEELYSRVWNALNALNPPPKWRPLPENDPMLTRAFDLSWPTSEPDNIDIA